MFLHMNPTPHKDSREIFIIKAKGSSEKRGAFGRLRVNPVLVASYGFGGGFLGLGRFAAVAIGWGDADGLIGVGEVCRDGFGDVGNRADLDYRLLRLLEDEFFVDGTNTGLLLK